MIMIIIIIAAEAVINGFPGQLKTTKEKITITDQPSENVKTMYNVDGLKLRII